MRWGAASSITTCRRSDASCATPNARTTGSLPSWPESRRASRFDSARHRPPTRTRPSPPKRPCRTRRATMFVTKKHLSRRTVLRGMGVTMALPLLDAMIPARTALAHTAGAPSPKLAFVYFPHGAIMSKWTPAGEGKSFELAPLLEPLAPFLDQLTIVSGLENKH